MVGGGVELTTPSSDWASQMPPNSLIVKTKNKKGQSTLNEMEDDIMF